MCRKIEKPIASSANRVLVSLVVIAFAVFIPNAVLGQNQQSAPAPPGQSQTDAAPPADGGPQANVPPARQGQSADQDPASDPQQNAGPGTDSQPRPEWRRFSERPSFGPGNQAQQDPGIPLQLTLQPGTYVTVRVNHYLSSDKNRPGDAFSATLSKPLVVDGIVVAQRGQTVGGRVVEAQKAGRIKGVSRLGLALADLTLADGQQVRVETQFSGELGPTSKGRDAAAIGTTTGIGAAIGAAASGGTGAAIGAGSGALASTIGVLLTRGRATEVYPETELTFRLASPVTISTDRAPQAFRYVSSNDYDRPSENERTPRLRSRACPPYGCPPPYYAPYYPYYWGPSFSFWYGGPRFYGHGRYRHW